MNPKITKLRTEFEKNKRKISDLQGRNRELEKQIRELEDTVASLRLSRRILMSLLEHAQKELEDQEFIVLKGREAFRSRRFLDIGAVVYFARQMEWEFPGFSVEKCFEPLWELHCQLERDGFVESREHRYLLAVQKPD